MRTKIQPTLTYTTNANEIQPILTYTTNGKQLSYACATVTGCAMLPSVSHGCLAFI